MNDIKQMMDTRKIATSERSLMVTLKALNNTADNCKKLCRLSDTLLEKMNRTEVAVEKQQSDGQDPIRDIIELYDDVNARLENYISYIEKNINKVNDMIE